MPELYGDTAAVLVVDDEPQLAVAVVHILERAGYRVTVAANASEARARLADKSFALALVDVNLPDESGLDLAAELLRTHRDVAVIMVTGIDDPAVADVALEAGAYGYVTKPFLRNELLIKVANAGRRRCLEIEREQHIARLEQQLTGSVAHDLGNLLTVIVNYVGFVAEEVEAAAAAGDERWQRVRNDVAQIEQAARRAIDLIT